MKSVFMIELKSFKKLFKKKFIRNDPLSRIKKSQQLSSGCINEKMRCYNRHVIQSRNEFKIGYRL